MALYFLHQYSARSTRDHHDPIWLRR
ncbi:hypothetical protein MED222_04910 [Vibrio sp. MED222]|nr:hypothetical protein MED222_04910 [Vibrio sp. MED222]